MNKEDFSMSSSDSWVKQVFKSRSYWTFSIIFSALMIFNTTKNAQAMKAGPVIFLVEIIIVMIAVLLIQLFFKASMSILSKNNNGGKK